MEPDDPAAPEAPFHPRERLGVWGVLDALATGAGLACAAVNAIVGLRVGQLPLGVGVAVVLAVFLAVAMARGGRGLVRAMREVLVLGVLVAWGLALNHQALARCRVTTCDLEGNVLRPLAEPQVFGLLALHAATALAYAVSRRRPGALHPRAEVAVHAALVVGLGLHALLAVQFAKVLPLAVLLPATLPVLAPLLTLWLYGRELLARLRRRGAEAVVLVPAGAPTTAFREAPPVARPGVGIDRALLRRALVAAPALAGLWAVAQTAWLGRPGAALEAFTATCGYALSRIPAEVVSQDCHYLCTVAAQGHPWLVGPERVGRRGGRAIVVNRQLAVANAFEDLLHERWPRFGAWARRTYDAVGLPVSRYIRWRWLADAVYVAMKPAEWCFLLALLLLDRRDPEARIDRMYR